VRKERIMMYDFYYLTNELHECEIQEVTITKVDMKKRGKIQIIIHHIEGTQGGENLAWVTFGDKDIRYSGQTRGFNVIENKDIERGIGTVAVEMIMDDTEENDGSHDPEVYRRLLENCIDVRIYEIDGYQAKDFFNWIMKRIGEQSH